MVRRLPVVQESTSEDAVAAARPRWLWTALTAVVALLLFLPLAALATPLGVRIATHLVGVSPPDVTDVADGTSTLASRDAALLAVAVAVPPLVAFAGACLGAGAIVGRFGGRSGAREASLAAAVAAATLASFSFFARGAGSITVSLGAFVALLVAGPPSAAFGALWAQKKRPAASLR